MIEGLLGSLVTIRSPAKTLFGRSRFENILITNHAAEVS
ncbi:hypothetical protein V202x_16040 [Gimesia aquarii]|uniref:Uncharacterized protein n=1 Tax=Gimesia aquarii TaxID=2527964 RepID=A0A517WSK2_9PLAN|nr:hypothetical protein V202x_16040 [Gimesia aquarii]